MNEVSQKNTLWWRWVVFALIAFSLAWMIVRYEMPSGKSMVGQPMPDFSLQDFNGQTYSKESLEEKFVIITFWASWCQPCVEEMPSLQAIHEKYKDKGLVVLGINLEDEKAKGKVQLFLERNKITFPILRDLTGKVSTSFGVTGSIPHNFAIDQHQNIIFEERVNREWDDEETTKWIEQHLAHTHEGH